MYRRCWILGLILVGLLADWAIAQVERDAAAVADRYLTAMQRKGYVYPGLLPFHNTVVTLWGNGPSLHFVSNADFRGHHGVLFRSSVYDVVRCTEMRPDLAPMRPGAAMEAWLAREGRGDLTLDRSTLVAVRGAKIATVSVRNWFDADKLSDDQLRAVIRDGACDQVSISGLPPMNGPCRGDRSQGEFFVVVQTRESRLAVINLHNFEFNQLMFWCRPRATKPITAAVPATQP